MGEAPFQAAHGNEMTAASPPTAAGPGTPENGANPPAEGRPSRILVADDSAANRRLLVEFLGSIGFVAESVMNGAEAMEAIRTNEPDLLLLDLDMPVMDGFSVLETLRSEDHLGRIPVIMISGLDDRRHVARCIELGAEDFLPKPFDPILLKARVTASLARKHARDREHKLAEELAGHVKALKQAEALRDATSNMLVHDLATPLSVIRMNVELLALKQSMGILDPTAVRGGLDKISEASESLSRLVQGILDVARLESGQMNVRLSLVECSPLLAEVADTFRAAADEHTTRLTVMDHAPGARIFADEDLVRRMLQNLVANAIKYAGAGAEVRLTSERRDDAMAISVSDDGPGIPEQAIAHVFDAFYQAPNAGSTRYFGVGLGLAFCRLAAEAQGARITARSTVGSGTTFCVEFR